MNNEKATNGPDPRECPYCGELALSPDAWRPPYEKFWRKEEVHPDDLEEFEKSGPACTGCYDPWK